MLPFAPHNEALGVATILSLNHKLWKGTIKQSFRWKSWSWLQTSLQVTWAVCQGIVIYMSCVKVFATRIKNESSNQSTFESWSTDQGTSELQKWMDLEWVAVFDLWTAEIKWSRLSDMKNYAIKHTFHWSKILIPWSNTSADAREVTTPCTLHLPASTNASCTSESVGSVLEANSLYTLAVRPSSVISDTRTNEIRIGYGVHYLET